MPTWALGFAWTQKKPDKNTRTPPPPPPPVLRSCALLPCLPNFLLHLFFIFLRGGQIRDRELGTQTPWNESLGEIGIIAKSSCGIETVHMAAQGLHNSMIGARRRVHTKLQLPVPWSASRVWISFKPRSPSRSPSLSVCLSAEGHCKSSRSVRQHSLPVSPWTSHPSSLSLLPPHSPNTLLALRFSPSGSDPGQMSDSSLNRMASWSAWR